MVGALWTGISGLAGAQRALDNESNNIANVNTLGYKASRISFVDQMYQDNIGKGVSSFHVEKLYTQGNLKVTGVGYDMALSGDGFFQLSDGNELYYSRAGNFRMGENGELENAGSYKVQGWAMAPIQSDTDVVSTDSNSTKLTNDYSKLLGNVIIRDTTEISTIVAKATDYTETAVTDSASIYSGGGQKTAASKISDVETLITEYNRQLALYANADPKPGASESTAQKDLLDLDLDTAVLEAGDKIYIIINGDKYFETIETTELDAMKKLVDKISNKSGFNAYMTDGVAPTATDASEPTPRINTSTDVGQLVIESLVPGIQFTVQEFGWTKGDQTTKGTVQNLVQSSMGTGMGAIKSVEQALAEAVSGEQQDVYTNANEFGSLTKPAASGATLQENFTYQITIYDKDLKMDVTIPTTPLPIAYPDDMSDFADAINSDAEMNKYLNAYIINGNLVVQPKSEIYDVEFSNKLKMDSFPSNRGGTGGGSAPALYDSFSGVSAPKPDGVKDFELVGTIDAEANTFTITIDDPADIDAMVAAINTDNASSSNAHFIAENIDGKLVIYPSKDDGNTPAAAVKDIAKNEADVISKLRVGDNSGAAFVATTVDISKSALYSGNDGAGGEFLAMTTKIIQTATKSDIQLRLDSLDLTDSAFGDFRVDDTGLIIMKQDGADFAVGQVAIAKFTDNRGLTPMGDNLMQSTNRSGQAIFNIDNDKTASIKGGTLELSTSDLSESLVNLMVFQRAFEANAKSITTADQILTTLIQLKR